MEVGADGKETDDDTEPLLPSHFPPTVSGPVLVFSITKTNLRDSLQCYLFLQIVLEIPAVCMCLFTH